MRFYEINRILSFVLIGVSTVTIGLWIALMVLHFLNNQNIHIESNQLFYDAYNQCKSTFTNTAYGGLSFMPNGGGLVPAYGNLLVQDHQNYQFISVVLLFASGPFEIITLILSLFLLLKSRTPYKTSWYLWQLKPLKTAIYIFSWLGLITTSVYFGYTLTFYLRLGVQDCTVASLREYANGYFNIVLIGGIMLGFALINYGVSIAIRKEPDHLSEDLFKYQEQSKGTLIPIQNTQETKRKIRQDLHNIPKVNNYQNIEMVQYPPRGFHQNYESNHRRQQQVIQQPPKYIRSTYYNQNPLQSRFIPPSEPIKNPSNYYYVLPQSKEPVSTKHVELENKYNQNQVYHDFEKLEKQYKVTVSDPSNNIPSSYDNSPSGIQKQRQKIFNRGSSGSKQRSIIKDLKSRYG